MKKKVLIITRLMGQGGTEKIILQLCRKFHDKFDITVCSGGGVHVDNLEKLGVKHIKIYDIETKNIFKILRNFKIISKIIKINDIDIIHTHHRMAAFYAFSLSSLYKFRFINTVHNIFFDKKIFTKLILSRAINVAVGKGVANNLENFFKIDHQKIHIIYNSVERFKGTQNKLPLIETQRLLNKRIVANFGRLTEQKGFFYFLEAAKIVKEKNQDVIFLIVGAGELEDQLKDKAKSLNLNEEVYFLGFRNDVQNIMSLIDFTVLSSLWEGFPLTPIESFSVGTPVIATNIEGTNEIVINNFNGILVEKADSYDLANSILYLLDKEDIFNELRRNCKETYDNNFSPNIFYKKYLNLYK
ncbi:glycosyltransferase family 4 protein [Enterococcus casseliflavus]|uniref:glycosyltransferase family 4 protein n=1 Tax=Enterococcus casseliflavus TaxID=37734 RepID=UPI003D138C76